MERLKKARNRMGWSQRKLADEAGCSQQAILDYEKGRRRPTGDILVRLARILGVSSAYLLGLTDSPERDDRLPENWIAVVEEVMAQGYSPEDIRRLVRGLKMMMGQQNSESGNGRTGGQ